MGKYKNKYQSTKVCTKSRFR